MKHQLLFILLFFIVTIGQSQDVSSVIIYNFDQTEQQYFPEYKYVYTQDEDDENRMRAYDKYTFSAEDATWIMSQQMVRDYNEHQHLTQSTWTNYKNGSVKTNIDKKYRISYSADGSIAEAIEDRFNSVTKESSSKALINQVLKRVTDYRPLYNRYTPEYLAEHGFDLLYDESNRLVYGQLSSCRLVEYHYTYGSDGRATQVEVNRIGSNGLMEKQSKVILIHDQISKPAITSDMNISAFPNPTKDVVSIQLDRSMAEGQELVLTDLYGRLIRTIAVDAFQIDKKIDVSDLAAGIYLLSSETGGASIQLVKVD